MLIVTAGSDHRRYEVTIRFCEERCKAYGYKFKVYDLGGSGFGTPVSHDKLSSNLKGVRNTVKPTLILDAMNNTDEEFVAWIDGDATLIKRIDEIAADSSFDVGITVRAKRNIKKTHYINSGVLFFRNNAASRQLLQMWIDKMGPAPSETDVHAKAYCDQRPLEEGVLLPSIKVPLWDIFGTVNDVNGVRVKVFECTQYNNVLCIKREPDHDSSVKIIHFKGKLGKPYLSKEYLMGFLDE